MSVMGRSRWSSWQYSSTQAYDTRISRKLEKPELEKVNLSLTLRV
eukprot:COSAG01_NODE_39_length_33243_cov_28.298558_14_plen_45_part_00